MQDYLEKYRKQAEASRKAEEEEVRWYRHLQDIKEGKEDTQAVILEKDKEIQSLKEKLSKYEKVH